MSEDLKAKAEALRANAVHDEVTYLKRLLTIPAFLAVVAFVPANPALAQTANVQGGAWTAGHAPMYSSPAGARPILQDSGPAQNGAAGLGFLEWLQVNRAGNGDYTAPYANNGTGPLYTHNCAYDGPTTGQYHYLCFDANAQGGGLIAYGAGGGASALPLQFYVNGAAAFTGTKTAGACTFTISGGIITSVTGC